MKHVFTRNDMIVAFDKGRSIDSREIFLGELEALYRVRNKQTQKIIKRMKLSEEDK